MRTNERLSRTVRLAPVVAALIALGCGRRADDTLHPHQGPALAVAFAPDGRLASGGADGAIVLSPAPGSPPPGPTDPADPPRADAHPGGVLALAFSPAGDALLSGGADGRLVLRDPHAAREARVVGDPDVPDAPATDVAWASDARAFLAAGQARVARLHAADGAVLHEFDSGSHAADVSPDGRDLLLGHYGIVRVFDAASGVETRRMEGHEGDVFDVAFSPDGLAAASAGQDGTVRVWNLADGVELARCSFGRRAVLALVWTPDGRALHAATADGVLRRVEAGSGVESDKRRAGVAVHDLALSPDGAWLAAACDDGAVRLWRVDEPPAAPAPGPTPFAVALGAADQSSALADESSVLESRSPVLADESSVLESRSPVLADESSVLEYRSPVLADESSVLEYRSSVLADESSGSAPETEKSPENRPAASPEPPVEAAPLILEIGEGVVRAALFSPDGRRVAAAAGPAIRLWDAATGETLQIMVGHDGGVAAIDFEFGGGRILSGGDDGTIRLWDAATGEEVLRLGGADAGAKGNGKGAVVPVAAVALASDGATALAARGGGFDLWDLRKGARVKSFEGHAAGVCSLRLAPDRRRCLSAALDGSLGLWLLVTGERTREFRVAAEGDAALVQAAAILSDGEGALVAAGDKALHRIDFRSGETTAVLRGHGRLPLCVAAGADGRRAISGDAEGIVLAWDLSKADAAPVEIGRHEGAVRAVDLARGGDRALSAGDDARVVVRALAR